MNNLDDQKIYTRLDPNGFIKDAMNTAEQIELAWNGVKNFVIPSYYLKAKNIVFLGVGGSGIAGEMTRTMVLNNCKLPIITHGDYDIPGFVSSDSLVIGISFSGNTEEIISSLEQAVKKDAKCIAVGSGGKLESLAKKYSFPFFKVKYKALQPRASVGSQFTAVVGILSKLGYLEITDKEINKTITLLRELNLELSPQVSQSKNGAKKLAKKIGDRIPIIIGSGTLAQAAVRWKRNITENAKCTSYFEILPEMNHHATTGLEFPKKLGEKIFFIILQSSYDHPRNVLRQNIIQNIFKRRKINYELIGDFKLGNPFSEIMQFVLFSDYVSYYMGILNNINPEPIHIVDYIKEQLAKHH